MKYFIKTVSCLLLFGVMIMIAFGQETEPTSTRLEYSEWLERTHRLTDVDPVSPLGEGEESLIKHKMSNKVIQDLIDSFVDRAEAVYTEKYSTPDGLVEWLHENPKLRSTFWLALSPFYDNIGKAMEVLNELRKADTKATEKFYHLAVAFAVVWDNPEAVKQVHEISIGGVEPDQFEPLANYLDNFKYFTDPRNYNMFVFKPDKLVWPLLVHVVDMSLTKEEIEWGIKKYEKQKGDIVRAYNDLEYDYDKIQKKPKLGKNKYNLSNLLKYGGICGDQAHYATRLAKIFCIPAMKVEGTGRHGGAGHAWVGYLASSRNGFDFRFHGRFFLDYYYTGDILSPQTCTCILDRQVAMLYDGANRSYAKYINSLTLARMAESLMTDKPELSVDLAINALSQQNYFCASAWLILMEHVKNGTLKVARGNTWLKNMFKYLNVHPDITILGLNSFMKCIPEDDHRKRDNIYYQADKIYKAAKRPDLQIRLALLHGDELVLREQATKAIGRYIAAANEHFKEGALILPLIKKADELFRKLKQIKEAIAKYEEIIKKIPKKRQEKISPAYQDMAKFLVAMYEEAGMSKKAEQLRLDAQL